MLHVDTFPRGPADVRFSGWQGGGEVLVFMSRMSRISKSSLARQLPGIVGCVRELLSQTKYLIRNLLHLTQPRKEENGGEKEKISLRRQLAGGRRNYGGGNGSGSLVTDSVHLVRTESAVTPLVRDQ
ncbi:hypothetical protein CDAR_399161 [Caerostris darwini]|uniref:Uncharacterized protein n=1 Tax=Caerostris darwini TaxID=1538125 RepID=A0AAV4SYK3_9ARAC|nr:hypothetical protein CDAR_399161 [Caerostris darwini]